MPPKAMRKFTVTHDIICGALHCHSASNAPCPQLTYKFAGYMPYCRLFEETLTDDRGLRNKGVLQEPRILRCDKCLTAEAQSRAKRERENYPYS